MNTHDSTLGRNRSIGVWLTIAGLLLVVALTGAGCAQVTSLDSEVQVGKYKVSISIDPKTVNPPQYGTLSYSFVDTSNNKPVTQFQPTSGALLHNVLISRDLLHFWHSYTQELTEDKPSGTELVSVSAYFPIFSKYYSYAIFTPLGEAMKTVTTTVTTGSVEGDAPSLKPDQSAVKTVGWLTFSLLKSQSDIKSGAPTQLVFNIRERGNPVTALWPLLESPAHMWVVDENGQSFGHEVASSEAHDYAATPQPGETATPTISVGSPQDTATPAPTLGPPPTFAPGIANALATSAAITPEPAPAVQQTAQASVLGTPEVMPGVGYGPDLAFTHTFPHPGLYKLWVEVLYHNQVVTGSYVVNVVQ